MTIPRIHCHSAYKHYYMFHNNSGSSYGNSIFNTTYNFNGGTMCGGGFWGGFAGGLGMGLGAGLMNLFGGFFGGGMGFGFPMFGGWGNWGGGYRVDGAGGKEKETKVKEKIVEKEVKNKDTKLIGNYSKDIDVLRDSSKTPSVTKEQLQNLYDKINKSKSEQDDIEKDADTDSYTNLLNDLKKIAEQNGLEFKDGKFVEKEPKKEQPVQPPVQPPVEEPDPTDPPTKPVRDYIDGYQNVKEDELDNLLKAGTKVDIIDTSNIDDMYNREILSYDSSSRTISIKDKNGIKHLKYRYVRNDNGELIFKSNKSSQEYILQKDSNGNIKLVQYVSMNGHGTADVTKENKDKELEFAEE